MTHGNGYGMPATPVTLEPVSKGNPMSTLSLPYFISVCLFTGLVAITLSFVARNIIRYYFTEKRAHLKSMMTSGERNLNN